MDWKREAWEKLTDYEARRRALENIPAEIHRLELEYSGIRSAAGDGSPVQGGGSRREDMLLSNIVRREELARQLEGARAWVEMVDRGLACLDEEERVIMDRLYIHREHGAFSRLLTELDMEKSALYRRRDRALRRFTVALYGGLES